MINRVEDRQGVVFKTNLTSTTIITTIKQVITFTPNQTALIPLKLLTAKQNIYSINGIAQSASGIESSFSLQFKHSLTDTVGTLIERQIFVYASGIPVVSTLDYTTVLSGMLALSITNNLNENVTLNLFIS